MKLLEKTLKSIVLAGIFALPFICLIVSSSLFFPYITGKNFAFRVIVEVMTGAWLALALVNENYRPRKSWLLGAFALFTLIVAIADAHGAYPFKSFWSNYERMDGWVTLAHLFAYFVVATSALNTADLWRRLWQTSLGVSAYMSAYGLLQVLGVFTVGQGGQNGLMVRIDATFGNPIYLAAYMLFNIFIAAVLWAQASHERKADSRTWHHYLYGSVIVLDTIVLLLTGTRGTTLGLVGGVFVSAFLYVILSDHAPRARKIAVGVLVAVIALAGALWASKDSEWIKHVDFLNRLATISLQDKTVGARFMNWGIALQGVKERPLLGWGQENYAIVFDKYYDPRMYSQEPWFDRVHNIVFDWLIAAGLIGLLSYLSLYAAAKWTLLKSDAFSVAEKSLFFGLFAGYFFHNLFVFDNVMSYILFTTVLAYIAWKSGDAAASTRIASEKKVPPEMLPVVAIIATAFTLAGVYLINGAAYAQNLTLIQAIQGHKEGASANLDYFKKAAAYHALGTQEVREQLSQITGQVLGGAIPNDIKQGFYTLAVQEMSEQMQASPLDARFPLFLSVLYSSAGDLKTAEESLEKAHELSPKKQVILSQLGALQMRRDEKDAALQSFKDAFTVATENLDARLNYTSLLIRAGKYDEADALLAPITASGQAADPRIASAYAEQHKIEKIIPYWKAHIIANPKDVQAYLTLAAAYYQTDDAHDAILTLQAAAEANPGSKSDIEKLIEQVRNGTVKLQ